jgi:hypothetical protein
MPTKNMERLIGRGRRFLEEEQRSRGNFLNYTSSDPNSFRNAYACESVFSTALILSCLNGLKDRTEFRGIRDKAARFLLGQRSEHWTFNYWDRESKDFGSMPYPDDLDDTSCALAALHGYDPGLIDGEALARFVTVLTALEEREGGPYRTWTVSGDADPVWRDVDLAVNGNVAHFLSLYDVALPEIDRFIEESIERGSYSSPYYPDEFPVIYFLSRAYRGNSAERMAARLLERRKKSGMWGDPLRTALAVSALLNLGVSVSEVSEGVRNLADRPEEAFRPYPFYVGINPKGDRKAYYAGAASLTVSFCLEALGKYLEKGGYRSGKTAVPVRMSGRQTVRDHVVREVQKKFLSLSGELKSRSISLLDKTVEKDEDGQILLLPYFFQQALGGRGKNIPRPFVVSLGLANAYGWMAYTVYDDFLDGEGDPGLLPLANVCLRELSLVFAGLFPSQSGFRSLFRETLDRLDYANCWETVHARCRVADGVLTLPETLPDYGDYAFLADRSLGHALGPMAIWEFLGYSKRSAEWRHTLGFFRHVLAARQLNDDAHDWESDLKRGILSSVATDILRRWRSGRDPETSVTIDFRNPEALSVLQEVCWNEAMPDVCGAVLAHAEKAERHLGKLGLSQGWLLQDIVGSVKGVAEKALKEREQTLRFLEAYRSSENPPAA